MRKGLFVIIVSVFVWTSMLIGFLQNCSSQPPGWSEDIRLTYNTNNSANPVIGVWENYVHIFWCEQIPGPGSEIDIFYIRSDDRGKTWGDTRKLIDTDKTLSGLSVALNQSTIHLVWSDKRSGANYIYYTNSSDNGNNWDIEKIISSPSSGGYDPEIAVNGNNIHVVYWHDFKLFYMNSTDDGISWSEVQQLTGPIRDSKHPSMAVNETNIHIVWLDHYDKNGQGTAGAIFYMNSTDGGLTWSEDINLTEMDLDACYPYIAVNGSIIHVVYSKEISGLWQGYYKRSEDNGISWTEDIKILNSSTDIGIDGISIENDIIHVVGGDDYISDSEIYYIKGYNNGQNWNPQTRLTFSPEDSARAKIAVYNGEIHVVWRDYRDGNLEIYYKQYPVYADLSISPDNITFSDNILSIGIPSQINATIKNIGDENASATIEFWDGNPDNGGIFIDSIDVTVNIIDSVNTSVNWIPITNGIHNIYIKITNTLETNLSNNIANKSVLVNQEPELADIPSIYTLSEDTIENQLINLSEYASDDLDSWDELTFSIVSYSNSSIVNVSIFNGHFLSVDSLTDSANDNWTGTIEIVIEVTDTNDLTNVSNQFIVTVTEVNDPPVVINSISDFSMLEDTINITAVDLIDVFFDCDNVSLRYFCIHRNISVFISNNGTVAFIPPENWTGIETLTFYATDNLTPLISEDVTITVIGINDPPVITALSPSNNSNYFTSDTIYFNISVFDVDSDSLIYLWEFDDGTTSTLKNATHQFSEAGIYNVSITVSDGSASDMRIVTIVVEPTTVDEGENGFNILGYLWVLIPIIVVVVLLFFFIWQKFKIQKDDSEIKNSFPEDESIST